MKKKVEISSIQLRYLIMLSGKDMWYKYTKIYIIYLPHSLYLSLTCSFSTVSFFRKTLFLVYVFAKCFWGLCLLELGCCCLLYLAWVVRNLLCQRVYQTIFLSPFDILFFLSVTSVTTITFPILPKHNNANFCLDGCFLHLLNGSVSHMMRHTTFLSWVYNTNTIQYIFNLFFCFLLLLLLLFITV